MNIHATGPEEQSAVQSGTLRSWPAHLELIYRRNADRTCVTRRHKGPLMIQRPFYPERDGTCHTYVLHPPGGVAGGDTLDLTVEVDPGARCLLTSPGATKVYRAPGPQSRQTTLISVAEGGVCEWMPMETILFDAARATFTTKVRLCGDAIFFGWELVSLGRPAAGESFVSGKFTQSTKISRDGRPVWFERSSIDGGSSVLGAAHGFARHPIFGTALYVGSLPEGIVEILRNRVPPPREGLGAFTQTEGALVCRYIGSKVAAGRGFFAAAWRILRQAGQGKPASIPRIWAT